MKKLNKKLTTKQIRLLQISLFLIGGLFLLFYFLSMKPKSIPQEQIKPQNAPSIYYQNQQLHIANDTILFKNSAKSFATHGDYLLIREPFIQTTHIYSIKQQKKIKDIPQIALDFDGKNILSQKGATTFFNTTDLQTTCFGGYIKSPTEILCIVPKADDNLDNKLVSLNPLTLKQTDAYRSTYTINYVTTIVNTFYLGGYNLQTKEKVLIVNGKVTPIQNRVSLVYMKENNIYVASLQDNTGKNINNYSLVKNLEGNTTIQLEGNDGILLK
jgi:hypothetical protein